MSYRPLKLFNFLLVFFFLIRSIQAQTVPAGQRIGSQSERFSDETDRKRKQAEEKKPVLPKIENKEESPAAPSSPPFILNGIKISGMTVFKPGYFKILYHRYIGQSVSIKEIQLIVDKIKSKYSSRGYLTSLVTIPEQDVSGGIVEIRVMEGRMGALKIEGNKWCRSSLLQKYIHLRRYQIFDVPKLERDLLRINKMPDVSVKSVLSPGQDPQTSDVILKVEDRNPLHAGFSFDNQGTRLVGRAEGTYTVRSSNLTGIYDSLYSSFLFGRREDAQSISYTRPINSYGTKLGISFSRFELRLGKDLTSSDITGKTEILNPYFIQELYLSEDFDIEFNSGIEIKSVKEHSLGRVSIDDQLRTPYLGFDFIKNDSFGQTTFSPRVDFGTSDFWGSSEKGNPLASRQGTGGVFQKYDFNLMRLQRMFFDSYCIFHTQAQFTSFSLSSSEQLQLGGLNSIRGYPQGDYMADQGVVVNLDWVFPLYLFPDAWKLPRADEPLKQEIEPVAFIDWGHGSLNSPTGIEPRAQTFTGVGGGFKVSVIKNVAITLEWAKPVGPDRPVSGSGPATFYLVIQGEF